MREIPFEYRTILQQLQEQFPEAVLAGGALRDWYFNRPVKDLDIFIQDRGAGTKGLIEEAYGVTFKTTIPEHIATYKSLRDLVRSFEGVVSGYRVNVVSLKEGFTGLEQVVDRIDIGICQIGYDGTTPYATVDFWNDALDQVLRVVHYRDESDLSRSHKRQLRLAEKYPDFRIVT